jgi:hypothetical protein
LKMIRSCSNQTGAEDKLHWIVVQVDRQVDESSHPTTEQSEEGARIEQTHLRDHPHDKHPHNKQPQHERQHEAAIAVVQDFQQGGGAPRQQQHIAYPQSRSNRGGGDSWRSMGGGGGSARDTAQLYPGQQHTHHRHHHEPSPRIPQSPQLELAGHRGVGVGGDADGDEIDGMVNAGKGLWRQFVNVATAVKDEVKYVARGRGSGKEANLSLVIPPVAAQQIDRHLRHRAKELVNSTASGLDEGAIRMYLDQGVATITQAAERKSIALRDNCVGLEIKRLQSEHGARVVFELFLSAGLKQGGFWCERGELDLMSSC